MDRIHSEIRKVSVGSDLKNSMTYQVGSIISGMTISRIEEDIYDGFFLQTKSYVIYVTKDSINEHEWKKISGLPIVVEYVV